ncbi:NACHT domain- and WD repeat-containing protein 1 [Aplochiton taeniatus]
MELMRGQGTEELEPQSNVVRVFICSTLTDMSSERKALMDKAYPEVQAFCQSLGLVFEVVDMRWGIQNALSADHSTTDLFLKEIKNSKKISMGPSFVVLLGSRYGHRSIPRFIPEKNFEVLLSKLSKNQEGQELLNRWFLKDLNAIPPVYVLQPITTYFARYDDLRPESGPQRDSDVLSWRFTEARLLKVLREAAVQAEKDGDITPEQKHHFFKSATECEVQEGLWEPGAKSSPLLFVREVPRQRQRDGPKRLAKYLDVTTDGLLDAEAQLLLTGLKSRLYTTSQSSLNLHCVELHKGLIDPKRKEHAQYLESLCEQFVSQMKTRISMRADPALGKRLGVGLGGLGKGADIWDWVIEVSHHMSLSRTMCAGFQGRQGLLGKICLAMWESSSSYHRPLVVHGAAGMGKTAVLCKLAQEMRSVLAPRAGQVIRLLGACVRVNPEVESMLRALCLQICGAFSLTPPASLTANTYVELVRFFHVLLAKVSQQGETLLLILDSLDQLSESSHAHNLFWLPKDIPPNIHLVVSVNTGSRVYANLQRVVDMPGNFFEVGPLSRSEGKDIMEAYMRASQRALSPQQSEAVLDSFDLSGSPLHLRLTLARAKHWASYSLPEQLQSSPPELLSHLLLSLEEKHGKKLVEAALGCIALARDGMSESELCDVLSLDNDVLAEVYAWSLPPQPALIRLPPLLWAQVRHDLGEQLVELWANGVLVLRFQHRQLAEMVQTRYLSPEQKSRLHRVMAEYFLGRWSQGKLKPISLPKLSLLLSDRKVPPQPLWFAPEVPNWRKLQELPYHLTHAGLWDELCHEVIGSTDWLYCKSWSCGLASVIQDLTLCVHHTACTETQLIRDALTLLKPTVDFLDKQIDLYLLYSELFTRLQPLAELYPRLIGQLCSQCEAWLLNCPEPVLLPKCCFLQPPGGALKTNLSGFHKGVTALDVCPEMGVLVAGSEDGMVIAWNLWDLELLQTLGGHTAMVVSIKAVASGTQCLSLAQDGILRSWSLLTGRQLLCIQEAMPLNLSHPDAHIHLSQDNSLLFVFTSGQVKAWHWETAEPVSGVSTGASVVLGVLNDMVVSLADGGVVSLSYPKDVTRTVEICLEKSSHGISSSGKQVVIAFSLDTSFTSIAEDESILLAGCERMLSLFRIERNSVERFLDLPHDDTVLCACTSSDNRTLVTGAQDQTVRWHLKYDPQNKPRAHIPTGCPHVALTKDGGTMYFVRREGQKEVITWDCHTGSSPGSMAVSAEVCCLELAQTKRLLFCGLKTGTVLIYPLDLPTETLCIPPPETLPRVRCMAIGAQEKTMVVAYEDWVCLFHITARDSFPSVEGPFHRFPLSLLEAPVSSMALLSDGRLLYGTSCGEVTLYDFSSSQALSLEGHRSQVTCVTPSNWGKHALVGSEDAVQRLWALDHTPPHLDHTMEYKGFHLEGILCAAFSESDEHVFTGSQDKTIKTWDVDTGNLVFVQYVYAPVTKMLTYRNGFMAISQQGYVIKEVFRCPLNISEEYNPLRNVKGQYRVTSRKTMASQNTTPTDLQDYNPAQFNLNFMGMLKTNHSGTCQLL